MREPERAGGARRRALAAVLAIAGFHPAALLIALLACQPAAANIIGPDPIVLTKALARIFVFFAFTCLIEAPVIALFFRACTSPIAAAVLSVAANVVSYPTALHLRWGREWPIAGVEATCIALEGLLILAGFLVLGRADRLRTYPAPTRVLAAVAMANLLSWGAGSLFF